MLRKFKVYDIKWDVDDPSELTDLPTSIDAELDDEIEDRLSDYLSDTYGFCHGGFCFEEVKADERK